MDTLKETSVIKPLLRYPYPVDLLVRSIFLWLILWGGALFELMPKPSYSFYESPLVEAVAGIGALLGGTLFLQGLIMIVTHWERYTLIIDKEGLHGVGGIKYIAWTEVASIGEKTQRYTALGQRASFLTIRVRSLNKILQRERGYTIWMRRLGKSPDFIIVNVRRKEMQSALKEIQRQFSQEIRKNNVNIYGTEK